MVKKFRYGWSLKAVHQQAPPEEVQLDLSHAWVERLQANLVDDFHLYVVCARQLHTVEHRIEPEGSLGLFWEFLRLLTSLDSVCSECLHYELQGVEVRISREEGLPVVQLSENTTHGPHIYARRVTCVTNQQLGCAIPPRRDVVGVLKISFRFDTPSETEIAKFDYFILADQQVLWLYVSMHHLLAVKVLERPQSLVDDLLDFSWLDSFT